MARSKTGIDKRSVRRRVGKGAGSGRHLVWEPIPECRRSEHAPAGGGIDSVAWRLAYLVTG